MLFYKHFSLLTLVTSPHEHKFTKWAAMRLISLLRNKEALVVLGSYQSVEIVDLCRLNFPPVRIVGRTWQNLFYLMELSFPVSAVQFGVLQKTAEMLSALSSSPHHEQLAKWCGKDNPGQTNQALDKGGRTSDHPCADTPSATHWPPFPRTPNHKHTCPCLVSKHSSARCYLRCALQCGFSGPTTHGDGGQRVR